MNKSNIQTNKRQKKNATVYATISVMVAFALIASPFLSAINDSFAIINKKENTEGRKGNINDVSPAQNVDKDKSIIKSNSERVFQCNYPKCSTPNGFDYDIQKYCKFHNDDPICITDY
ncbi:MAG: hypothetical protein AB7U98_12235 [Candidatus Nitrosocosmicus sp.]